MSNFIRFPRTETNQRTALFTGEGAYHGASNKSQPPAVEFSAPASFPSFEAYFPNICELKTQLLAPSQAEIQAETVTFVWAFWEQAVREADPLTKKVLEAMRPFLKHNKRFVYVDSKVQFFQKGDLPVDSQLWHIDGTMVLRGAPAQSQGYAMLHDLRAKQRLGITDDYLVYQSSTHCATEWVCEPLAVRMPEYIPTFDPFDTIIRQAQPSYTPQPAGAVLHFTDMSVHRAVAASESGWRLWVRVLETDKVVNIDQRVLECYNTVFMNR